MNVKTYRTKSLEEAVDQIKRDLGTEALILSTREVSASRPFGFLRKKKWEVAATAPKAVTSWAAAAAAPAFAPIAPKAEPVAKAAAKAEPSDVIGTATAPARRIHQVADRRIDLLLEEMDDLKRSVRSLGKALPATGDQGSVFNELISQAIDPDLADKLVVSASRGNPSPGEVRNRVRRLLADMIVVDPPAELHAKARVVSVFVGPTGVGKTTTIAKIAGQASVRFKKKVALISTDMLRVAGHEQLTRYGTLLNVPAHVCSDISTLKDLVQSLDDRELILVDTPGASPSDLARLSKLESVLELPEARVNLVMSATTRSEDVTRIMNRFQRFAPKRVIFTKIDETESKAAVVGDLLRSETAVSYLTNGQRVPDDLVIPAAGEMAKWVLPDA